MGKAFRLAQDTEPFCTPEIESYQVKLSYIFNTYGVVKLQHQDNDAAKEWFQRTYQIRKQYLGELDVNTVAVRGNIMMVLMNEHRYQEIVETLLPVRDLVPSTLSHLPIRLAATIFDQLAIAFMNLGRYDEAWQHMQKSVKMSKDTSGIYSQPSG